MDDEHDPGGSIVFTPPDTPTQYPSQDSYTYSPTASSPMNVMGTSPSSPVDAGAGADVAAAGGSPGPENDIVESNKDADALGSSAAVAADVGAEGSATSDQCASGSQDEEKQADETAKGHEHSGGGNDNAEDDGLTPSMFDYNQETEKFAPSEEAGASQPRERQEREGSMSPLTEGDGSEHDEDEDEDDIAQDGIYRQPRGVDGGSVGDDDDDDDEEFGSMPMFADTGLLTQSGGGGGDQELYRLSDSDESDHESEDADGERSQALLGTNDDADGEESAADAQDEGEGTATEERQDEEEDTETAPSAVAAITTGSVTEGTDGPADTGSIAGLTEEVESQTESATASLALPEGTALAGVEGGTASEVMDNEDTATDTGIVGLTEETETEAHTQTGPALASTAGGGADATEATEGSPVIEDMDIDGTVDAAVVQGLTEETERPTQTPSQQAVAASSAGTKGDGSAPGENADDQSSPVDSADVQGLTETETQTQVMSILSDSQKMPPPATPRNKSNRRPTKDIWEARKEDGETGIAMMNIQDYLGLTVASEAAPVLATSQGEGAQSAEVEKSSELHGGNNAGAQSGSQDLGSGPIDSKPDGTQSCMVQSPSQKTAVDRIADGSEDTYDSFNDLQIYSGATEPMVLPSMENLTANDSPMKYRHEAVPSRDVVCGEANHESLLAVEKSFPAQESKYDGKKDIPMQETEATSCTVPETSVAAGDASPKEDGDGDESKAPSSSSPSVPYRDRLSDTKQEEVRGTGTEGTSSIGLGDLYNNAETERFHESGISLQNQEMNMAVDTNASTPLISHTQTHIDGRSNSGFSYPRNEVDNDAEEKKFDSPSPAASSQEHHDVAMEKVGSQTKINLAPPADVNDAEDIHTEDPTEVDKSNVSKGIPASDDVDAVDSQTQDVAETTTVIADTTTVKPTPSPSSAKKKSSDIVSDLAITPNKSSSLTISPSPHSQPLLTPSNMRSDANYSGRSLLQNVEASSAAIAVRGQRDGGHDEIEDSDDDDQANDNLNGASNGEQSSTLGKDGEAKIIDPGTGRQTESTKQSDDSKRGEKDRQEPSDAEKKQEVVVGKSHPVAAAAGHTTTSKKVSVPAPAPWISSHRHSHKKSKEEKVGAKAEEVQEPQEEEEDADMEDDSEPTPRLRMPEYPKSVANRKDLEREADDFSSDDEERANVALRRSSAKHVLQDTQDSLSEDVNEAKKSSSTRTASSRRRLKNIRRMGDSIVESKSSSSSSRATKQKSKRKSVLDFGVQDSLATLGTSQEAREESSCEEEEEEEEEVDDDDDDNDGDVSVSSSISLGDVVGGPSQNTVEIDALMSKTRAALKNFGSRKHPTKQIEKLNRKVARLEKKNSQLKDDYARVRAENADLKKSLEKKTEQNSKMKKILAQFNRLAGRLSPDVEETPRAEAGYGSESSAESRAAPAPSPAEKKAEKKAKKAKASSGKERVRNAPSNRVDGVAPAIVPPSSVKPRGDRSHAKTSTSTSSSSKARKKKPASDESSDDDDNVALGKLKTPKTKGKKLDFERHKAIAANKNKPPADLNTTARIRSSRRGGSNRDVIPNDMLNVRFEDIWHFLRDEHGWRWTGGPAPYNNVYVRPNVNHMTAAGVNIDFYDDGVMLFAEAKKLGFSANQEVEKGDASEGSNEDEEDDVDAESEEGDDGSIRSGRKGRGGGYAQKQLDAVSSMAHISLSVSEKSAESDIDEECTDGAEEEEDVAEDEISEDEEENDDDESIVDKDDTTLYGDAKVLTQHSVHMCSRLIRKFAKQSEYASFNNLLWTPLWEQIKDGQGGDDADLKWNYARSKGQLAQRSFWYVAPQSKGSEGNPGVDYFETEEAVVFKVLREIQRIDPSLLATCEAQVGAFEAVLARAVENNVAFNDARSNPEIGGRRRNRRKTMGDDSPLVYSPPKKAKVTKAKAKASTRPNKSPPKKLKKSPLSKRSSPVAKRANKSVAFSETIPMSQNTLQGVESLLMLNNTTAAAGSSSSSAAAAASPESNKQDDNPRTPTYEDIVTKKGIESLRKARLRNLQDITPSPKKRAAAGEASLPSSSGRKKQKVRSLPSGETPSSVNTRLSQVPYQLCEGAEDMSPSDVSRSSSFSRRKCTNRTSIGGGKALPLDGLNFFGSGLGQEQVDLVEELGGKYFADVSSLQDSEVYGKLFFLSHVMQRRKLKYILASALGVPMLHYSWLAAIKRKFLALDDDDEAKSEAVKQLPYDSALFKAMRLPVGLSIKSGLYQLQKARHAKRWFRPGQETGKLVFKGLKLTVALEDERFEAEWENILKAAGATIVKRTSLKAGKKCVLDAVLVDRNSLPPHTTAVPSNITKCLNFIRGGNAKNSDGIAKIPTIDLSWALQCIVERERLSWDMDERYILYSAAASAAKRNSENKMFEMKAKTSEGLVRFEVGDIVEFGRTKGTARIGRILTIERAKRSCAARGLEVQLLDRNGNFELIDGGDSATCVRIDEHELRKHMVLLSSKDFKEIKKDGYLPSKERDTSIFLQKKPPSAKK